MAPVPLTVCLLRALVGFHALPNHCGLVVSEPEVLYVGQFLCVAEIAATLSEIDG